MEENKIDNRTSSISIKKMAKGYQWDVKVYFDADKDDHNDVLKAISTLEDSLKATYGDL